MIVRRHQILEHLLRRRQLRTRNNARCWGEGEVAVIALVQRLDEMVTSRPQRRRELRMRHVGPPDDVDRLSEQMIAVRYATDRSIVLDGSDCAADRAVPRRGPSGRNRDWSRIGIWGPSKGWRG